MSSLYVYAKIIIKIPTVQMVRSQARNQLNPSQENMSSASPTFCERGDNGKLVYVLHRNY